MRKYLDAFVTAVRDRTTPGRPREPTKPTEPTIPPLAEVSSVLSVESGRVCSVCGRGQPVMLTMEPGVDGRPWFLCASCSSRRFDRVRAEQSSRTEGT